MLSRSGFLKRFQNKNDTVIGLVFPTVHTGDRFRASRVAGVYPDDAARVVFLYHLTNSIS